MVKGSLSQAAIGRAMNLSASAMTKLKKQGMPMHSLEAALAWRVRHVRLRMSSSAPHASSAAEHLARLTRMWPIGRAALEAGAFDIVADELRAALAAVPAAARPSVQVDPAVMDALLLDRAGLAPPPSVPRDAARSACADACPDEAAAAWYAIAAGEPITSAQLAAIAPGLAR